MKPFGTHAALAARIRVLEAQLAETHHMIYLAQAEGYGNGYHDGYADGRDAERHGGAR